ncbi:MAG: hypothetical protein ACE5GX_16695 [Thermoanaerobaculia bacterium]
MTDESRITLRCPDCDSHLVVDVKTGEVLFHKPRKAPVAGGKDFDQLLDQLDEDKAQAEDVFNKEVSALKDRDRLLEDKFEEALKNAKESPEDEPPPRPWDLD